MIDFFTELVVFLYQKIVNAKLVTIPLLLVHTIIIDLNILY